MKDTRTHASLGAATTRRADLDPRVGAATVRARWNSWKVATTSILLVTVTALAATWVLAHRRGSEPARTTAARSAVPATARGPSEAPPIGPVSLQAMIDACHRTASAQAGPRDQAWEAGKDALLEGALTAGLGAAAGSLYGMQENHRHDEAYRAAYASCMRARGFTG